MGIHENLIQSFTNFKNKYIGNIGNSTVAALLNNNATAINKLNSDIYKGSVSVIGDGAKNYGQILSELFALINFNKINKDSCLDFSFDGTWHGLAFVNLYSPSLIKCTQVRMSGNNTQILYYELTSTNSLFKMLTITPEGTTTLTDRTSEICANGNKNEFIY